jgi:hypothetical protein
MMDALPEIGEVVFVHDCVRFPDGGKTSIPGKWRAKLVLDHGRERWMLVDSGMVCEVGCFASWSREGA